MRWDYEYQYDIDVIMREEIDEIIEIKRLPKTYYKVTKTTSGFLTTSIKYSHCAYINGFYRSLEDFTPSSYQRYRLLCNFLNSRLNCSASSLKKGYKQVEGLFGLMNDLYIKRIDLSGSIEFSNGNPFLNNVGRYDDSIIEKINFTFFNRIIIYLTNNVTKTIKITPTEHHLLENYIKLTYLAHLIENRNYTYIPIIANDSFIDIALNKGWIDL